VYTYDKTDSYDEEMLKNVTKDEIKQWLQSKTALQSTLDEVFAKQITFTLDRPVEEDKLEELVENIYENIRHVTIEHIDTIHILHMEPSYSLSILADIIDNYTDL
jgi:hypothetical protein